MFGIGKLLGSVAGGLLDKIGLGKIAPFVQLGINALTGNWLGVAKDVFGLVSGFKGNFLNNASSRPPLGGFEQNDFAPASRSNRLSRNRISDLFRGLSSLFRGFKAITNGSAGEGFSRIFSAFSVLREAFDNNQMFNYRSSASIYSNIRL
ncbi:MAG TPA: hypothetical protein VK400_16160 [Pyrinomonadaceae bacterium]|nr:hypothetical protein [Pyrinomonadaceae bacterium]